MEKSRLTLFKITNLFGYQTVTIDFENKYKIIIGENGLGKTTVLNCLYYLLDKKFRLLNEIPFDRIDLAFSNKSKISFSKTDLEFYVEKPTKLQGSQFYQILKDDLKKEDLEQLKDIIKNSRLTDQERRMTVVSVLKRIGININAPTQFIYDSINRFISESESVSFQKVIDTIDKNITSKILYFPTFRRIESQLDTFKFKNKSERNLYYHQGSLFDDESLINEERKDYEQIIQFGMDDVQKKIENITDEITQKSLVGFSKITGDLLSQLSREFPSFKPSENIDKTKLKIILDRVGTTISATDKSNIIEYINSGKNTNKGLLYLIDKLIALYNQQEQLDIAIKKFVETCNQYLMLKKFHYDESSVKVYIQRNNSTDIIKLDQLSSGEKQIVSLFSKIYLDLNKSFIVLFDEPELSLSILWQQKLLPDIINSNKCNFLFTVTHSPFIYDNEVEEYACGLTDYISFSNESKRTNFKS